MTFLLQKCFKRSRSNNFILNRWSKILHSVLRVCVSRFSWVLFSKFHMFVNSLISYATSTTMAGPRYIEYYSTLFCFWKSKQMISFLEGWIRQKTGGKCKQMYFIPETTKLIFGGLNINNKQYSTFTCMYLGLANLRLTDSQMSTNFQKTMHALMEYLCSLFHQFRFGQQDDYF